MRLIRGQRQREVFQDPWEGRERPMAQSDVGHVLTDEGAIESCGTVHRRACDCGCLKPPGGFCAVCSGTVCIQCYGFCQRCARPLCPRHSVFLEGPQGQQVRLCERCHDSAKRRRTLGRIGRMLLSPFVRFEDRHVSR